MMFFMASDSGLIVSESDSQHKEFVNQFTTEGEATQSLSEVNQQGIVSELGVAVQSLPIIGTLVDILTAPYSFLSQSSLPTNFVMLFQAIMGVFELSVAISLYRGMNF